ncbi:AAA family ATPase [Spirillospora sp. NPDC029432]|uniref:AAA family ATPase n=1 Tax=Spirillospora sp. NPDC029432 TaxID=3154599 RepID=UPI0034563C16
MTIQVLIGSADRDLAVQLRTQIAELAEIDVAGVETSAADILGIVATHTDLDVVLVDEQIGTQPGQELIREIGVRRPHVASVLLSSRVDELVLSKALEAGARGVLARQPSLEELDTKLATAAEWSRGMRRWLGAAPAVDVGGRRGRVVAVAGAKGGTGATTLAVQLALAASARRSVCLVDMDLQCGDVPSYLDLVHRRSIADLVGVADDITGQMLADALFIHEAGPHVLLAPAEGERAEDVTSLAARQILGALRSRYEVVVIDCGAFMTEGSVTAVELADQVLLTVTPDLPCLRAAKRMAQLWRRLDVRKPDELSVVITRQSRKDEIQPDFAARVLGMAPAKTTIPPADRALEKAVNNGAFTRVEDDGFRRAITQLAVEVGIVSVDVGVEARNVLRRGKTAVS